MQRRWKLSLAQRADMWKRWKAGQSLNAIGRVLGKDKQVIYFLLARHGGIAPSVRRRARRVLTLAEREDISRGIASGCSIRVVAQALHRAPSTVSREIARHGGRTQYRASAADQQAWQSALRPDIPLARGTHGFLHGVAASWRASSILVVQSGFPFTVNLSSAQDVPNIGLVGGNNLERPNLIGDPNSGPKKAGEWFNTSAFALPAQYSFGSAGRNDVVGPGFEDLDLSLQKEWTARENFTFQFRFDAFNALNHPNFNLPGRIFGAANFGVITSALDPRELQFGLKVLF